MSNYALDFGTIWDDWEESYRAYAPHIDELALALDEVKPNWYNDLDLDIFDVEDWEVCVVHQLYGPDADFTNIAEQLTGQPFGFASGNLWWHVEIMNRRLKDAHD